METIDLLYTLGLAADIAPYTKDEDFKLQPAILNAVLKAAGPTGLSSLHKTLAPNFVAGCSAIIVAPDLGGNTKLKRMLSYMLPVIQKVQNRRPTTTLGGFSLESYPFAGPIALIITATMGSALKFEAQLQAILQENCNPPLTAQYVVDLRDKKFCPDILISDINSVEKMMSHAKSGNILFDRLVCVACEDTDFYDLDQWSTLEEITDVALTYKADNTKPCSLQLVLTSAEWSTRLEELYYSMVKMRAFCILIDYLPEVIRFADILWKVKFVDGEGEEKRLAKMKDLLRGAIVNHEKLIVACKSPEKAMEIKNMCLTLNVNAEVVSTSEDAIKSEEPASPTVFIVPDEMLNKVTIEDCTYLLNFDNTSNQRLRLWHLWPSLPKLRDDGAIIRQPLVASYLMTGKEGNLLKFYRFSIKLDHVDIDAKWDAIGRQVHEEDVNSKPICVSFKLFGVCKQARATACYYRHKFIEDDVKHTPLAPCFGELEVIVLDAINPSQYVVSLIGHYSNENDKRTLLTSYEDVRQKRASALMEYYSNNENRVLPSSVQLEGIYAYETLGRFVRVKLLAKLCTSSNDNPNEICVLDVGCVQCLETGCRYTAPCTNLMILPPQFKMWPTLVVNLILGNLCPPKRDLEYTPKQITVTKRIFMSRSSYFAKVCLAVGDTVWVNPMIYTEDGRTSLRSLLIQEKCAGSFGTHLPHLIESIRGLGELYQGFSNLEPLKPTKAKKYSLGECHKLGDEIQWASIAKSTSDKIISETIKITYANHPWLFFGVISKFENLYERLEDELNGWIRKTFPEGPFFDSQFYEKLEPYSIVAVKEKDDGTWFRGMVVESRKNKNQLSFDVLLVDFGEILKNLTETAIIPIHQKFVKQLPFQCVAFSLDHIEPCQNSECWSESEIKCFLDTIFPNNYNTYLALSVFRDLKVKAGGEQYLPCRFYSAVAILGDQELGHTLAEKSCAVVRDDINSIISNLFEVRDAFLQDVSRQITDFESDDDEFEEMCAKFDVNFNVNDASNGWIGEVVSSTMGTLKSIHEAEVERLKDIKATCDTSQKSITHKEKSSSGTSQESQPQVTQQNLTSEQELILSINNAMHHPQVLWHQTISDVVFTVMLPDITEYDISIGKNGRNVLFQTIDPPGYGFYVKLFARVAQDKEVYVTGQYVKITMKKLNRKADLWRRVLADKTDKPKWLKVNLEYVEEQDEDDLEKNEPPRFCPYEEENVSSESEDDNDEDRLFVAPEKYHLTNEFFEDYGLPE